jgi:hypothetical protein
MKMQPTEYELKYCERCGALGLRRAQSGETYCEPSGRILTNYSYPGASLRQSLLRQSKSRSRQPLQLEAAAQSCLSFGRLP